MQAQHRLGTKLASSSELLEQAFRLRHAVFVVEHGAQAQTPGAETDAFDAYCDHLVVTDLDRDAVVGYYRLLPGGRAAAGPGFYSETEFDLREFAHLTPHSLELGRSCVAAGYRDGSVVSMLWRAIAAYVDEHRMRFLMGCASLFDTPAELVADVRTYLASHHSCIWGRALPRAGYQAALPAAAPGRPERELFRLLPPLLKGYIRLGATFSDNPAYDAAFRTYDFFTVLDANAICSRYLTRFART